jgi:Rho-type GTPase-activating protein 1/2
MGNLNRTLSMRLENIKNQYQRDLVPLTQQRESLSREIAELKAVRDVFLEETTVLSARNEELAQLSAQYARRMDAASETPAKQNVSRRKESGSFDKPRPSQQSLATSQSLTLTNSRSSTYSDEATDNNNNNSNNNTNNNSTNKLVKSPKTEVPELPTKKFMKWPGSKARDVLSPPANDVVAKGKAHSFQQLSILRFTRCDHCGDMMWGSQVRCSGELLVLLCIVVDAFRVGF